jgi:hypothetical protein
VRVLWVFGGMAMPLLLVTLQKTLLSGESYLTAGRSSLGGVIQEVFSLERHRIMLGRIANDFLVFRMTALEFGPVHFSIPWPVAPYLFLLAMFVPAAGFRANERDRLVVRTAGLTVGLALVAYYFVFLVMPTSYNLSWLMDHFPRVLLQIWPTLVWTVLMYVRVSCKLAESKQQSERG